MTGLLELHIRQWPYVRWKNESMSRKAVGGVALTISTLAGSTFPAFSKHLSGSLSALSLLFVSEVLNGFFVLFSFGFLPVMRSMAHVDRKKLRWLALLGLLSGIGGPMLWFIGLSYTQAVNAALFAKSETIFLIILAHFVLQEKLSRAHFAAIASVCAGVVTIALHGFTSGLSFQPGDLFIIGSVLCYAGGNITFRSKLTGIEPHIALFSRALMAMTAFFLVSPFIENPFISEMTALPVTLIPVLIGFAFIGRFLNSVTYYVALDRIPVSTVSLVSTLDIIGATLFAFFYLGEPIEWYHYAGGAFIILGNVLLELLGTHPTEEILEEHLKQRVP